LLHRDSSLRKNRQHSIRGSGTMIRTRELYPRLVFRPEHV
jgi:hypothetical protein